jgi:hypothetical protein
MERKNRLFRKNKINKIYRTYRLYPIPDGVSPTRYPSETPKKREIKRRQPFDVYQDQVDLLKKLSLKDQLNGEIGSMSRMVREALDNYLKDKKL